MNTVNIQNTENFISYRHLFVGEDKESVIYLGYSLHLTKTEYLILKTLVHNHKKPISVEEISSLSGIEITAQNVAFHVFNINKKARELGNRNLIKNSVKNGYFLNEEM